MCIRDSHIGGIQLLVGSVQKNVINDRAVFPQAFQRFGIGGIAAFRLFARGQAKVFKQGLAQLLGAVYIELIANGLVDGCLLYTSC